MLNRRSALFLSFLTAFFWTPLFANKRSPYPNLDILTAAKTGNFARLSTATSEEINRRDFKNSNFTPLLYVLKQGNGELASILMTHGAETAVETDDGETPLFLAIKAGILTKDLLRKILRNGASIEHTHKRTGMTAVLYASQAGDLAALKLLSEHGASLDRRNPVNLKTLLDYLDKENHDFVEFLMTTHCYFTKTIERFGFHFIYDKQGFPAVASISPTKVSFFVRKDLGPAQIAEFTRKELDRLEYVKNPNFTKSKLSRTWHRWFANPFHVYYYDFFDVKDHIEGKSLAYYLSHEAVVGFESIHPRAEEVRGKLKSFLIRMLRNSQGFVGNMRTDSLIFDNSRKEWVLVDGDRSISCYATEEHMWVWTEYCPENFKSKKETLLTAFKQYTVGDHTQRDPEDAQNFGIWLKDPTLNGQVIHLRGKAKEKLTELIESISPKDLTNQQ